MANSHTARKLWIKLGNIQTIKITTKETIINQTLNEEHKCGMVIVKKMEMLN